VKRKPKTQKQVTTQKMLKQMPKKNNHEVETDDNADGGGEGVSKL
jgi:hypothetical protein